MKLQHIKLQNFRGFEDYDIDLGLESTVLIGKNGTGKSSLISAIRKGLSIIFAKSKVQQKTLSESNNCSVRSFPLWDTRFDEVNRSFSFPIRNSFKGNFLGNDISWICEKMNDPGSLKPTLYRDATNKILEHYNSNISTSFLPVLAFFSDSYPHVLSNVGEKANEIIKADILPRDFGYYGWDDETNCIELWQRRYIKASNYYKDHLDDLRQIEEQIELLDALIRNKDSEDEHQIPEWEFKKSKLNDRLTKISENSKAREFEVEKAFVDERIFNFSKVLSEQMSFINRGFEIFRVSVNRPDRKSSSIEFSFADGRTMHFEILPAGYKRLISIVFDISYRSYILNGNAEPEGIVLIDEIELHLHPTLQQEVMQRFERTFPKIQFIVASHSPIVISNFNSNNGFKKLVRLENEGGNYFKTYIDDTYGIDYSTNLLQIMDVAPRSLTVEKYINAYNFLIGQNKIDDANKLLEKLKEYLGSEIPSSIKQELKI